MNPILQQFHSRKASQQQQNNNIDNLMSDIQSGKINPQQEVLNYVKSMNPLQRMALKSTMPMISKLGKKFGVTDSEIQDFQRALNL